jgi:polyisoprenoid-binding protein YceI
MPAAPGASLRIFTFKAGLLSRVAHDLRLSMGRFEISLSEATIEATFWPATLRVDGAVNRGQLDRGALSPQDHAKIEQALREEVLHTTRHPRATFLGTVDESRGSVAGELELCGQTRRLVVQAPTSGPTRVIKVELTPTDFGVEPYRAMAGALRVKDRVGVELTLDWSPGPGPRAWNQG